MPIPPTPLIKKSPICFANSQKTIKFAKNLC